MVTSAVHAARAARQGDEHPSWEGYALPDPPTGWGAGETGFPQPPAGPGCGETRFPHTPRQGLMFTLVYRMNFSIFILPA